MFRVQLFGVPSIKFVGAGTWAEVGRPGQLLTSYLLTYPGRIFRREQLQEQFWGNLSGVRGRAAMNTAMWRIRKLLAKLEQDKAGPCSLFVKNTEILMNYDDRRTVDIHLFTDEVQRLSGITSLDDIQIEELQACADLYAGAFLDGEYADWVIVEREKLERMYIGLLSLLANCLTRARRFDEAISVANQILAIDPYREAIHRDLIVTFALNEQRQAAMRQFERLRCLLDEELGVSPARETTALFHALKSEAFMEHFDPLQSSCFQSSAISSSQRGSNRRI
jgi:DNA-binding SARP family transcriptional activator